MTDVKDLLEQIKSPNPDVRFVAWNNAGAAGAAAVIPLADVMGNPDRDIAKAGKEALHRIVHLAGRPYGAASAKEVAAALEQVAADGKRPRIVRIEALAWLSYIGDQEDIAPLTKLLSDPVVREDARLTLERIPGDASLAALRAAADTAPEDFKPNLKQSLYARQLTPKTSGIKPDPA